MSDNNLFLKKCIKCNLEKSTTEFYKHKNTKDFLRGECKICSKQNSLNNKEIRKQWALKNKEILNKKRKEYRKNLPANKKVEIASKVKEYQLINRKKLSDYCNIYHKKKRKKDILFKLKSCIRSNIQYAIKRQGHIKKSKTYEILGCSYEEFRAFIESKFTDGMNWENQGKWHFDHIIPVSLAKDEKHLIELNHYTNFQPLWAKDNLKKGNRIINN